MFQIFSTLFSVILLGVLVTAHPSPKAEGQCVMYGKCGNDPQGRPLNCAYDGPALPLVGESLDTLTTLCPEFIETYGTDVCCSADQILDLAGNLVLPEMFVHNCTSCYYNFRQLFCHFTCSPMQSKFLNVNETLENEEGQAMVYKLDVIVENAYVQDTYDACKNVKYSPEGDGHLAMDVLCGKWGAAECTPKRWFDYMGTIENGFSPFDIRFNYIEEGQNFGNFTPFHFDTIKCNQSPPNGTACVCSDCLEACLF